LNKIWLFSCIFRNTIKGSDQDKLKSHQIILKLATTSGDKVQLVTTNFDRLFSEVNSELKVYSHANIVNRKESLDGIDKEEKSLSR
jgi:NAD-dependent SIR2 family protein deacetylase